MRRPGVTAALALLLAAGGPAACTGDGAPPVDRLVIAGGSRGSIYDDLAQAYAQAVRDAWGTTVEVVNTGGPIENVTLVGGRAADIGITTVDVVDLALRGDRPYEGPQQVAALAGLYEDYLHVVVPAQSEIGQLGDLAGLRVSLGAEFSNTQVAAERALLAAGHELGDLREVLYLSPGKSADALRDGRIDAFFEVGGLPDTPVRSLSRTMAIRLLSVPEEVTKLQEEHGEQYRARSIPAGTYPVGKDSKETLPETATVGVANLLVVRQGMPDEVANALTELLFAAKGRLVAAYREMLRLDPRAALAVAPVPLHSGARRYYQESKPMAAGSRGVHPTP
jgi:uncharacterized protein